MSFIPPPPPPRDDLAERRVQKDFAETMYKGTRLHALRIWLETWEANEPDAQALRRMLLHKLPRDAAHDARAMAERMTPEQRRARLDAFRTPAPERKLRREQ